MTTWQPITLSALAEPRTRHAAVAAAILCALFSETLSFAGREVGVVMGRATMLVGPVAFGVHILAALVYGSVLAVAIGRAGGRSLWLRACGGLALLYAINAWVAAAVFAPRLSSEGDAVFAHSLFALAFICLFKMGEDDAPVIAVSGHALR
jgi:hypothetical protein